MALPAELSYKVEPKQDAQHFFDVHSEVMKPYLGRDLLHDKSVMARVQKDFYDRMAVGYQRMIDQDALQGGVFNWRVVKCARYDQKILVGKKILFIGAGNSRTAMIFAQNGLDVVATDISFNMLKIGKERAEEQGLDMTYVCHNAELPFPFKSGVFDTAYSYCVMNHIVDWRNYLTEKMRCLRENGVLLERMPNALRWDFWQGMGEMNDGMEIKAKYCSPQTVDAILKELGLEGEVWTHERQVQIGLSHLRYEARSWLEDHVSLPLHDDGKGLYTVFKVLKKCKT